MTNDEIIDLLKFNTKATLNYTFILMDYFDAKENDYETMAKCYFLAATKLNPKVKSSLKEFGITWENLKKEFKELPPNYDLKKINETNSFNKVNLCTLISDIFRVVGILFRNACKSLYIDIKTIEPEHIFYYFTVKYPNIINDVVNKFYQKEKFTDTETYCTFFSNVIDENIAEYNKSMNENEEEVKEYTPALNKYGYDLTQEKYIKDPSVGREYEIRRIEQILSYPEKDKSIIITGEAGCGKTALVRGLAYRIQKNDVPEYLKDLRIVSINTSSLVAGTKYVGTLEQKMEDILSETEKDKNIIIFIDEIHQALSGGKTEGNDNTVAEILKPYLDYGRVRIIGATTTDEYAEYLNSDPAFKTRFKKVEIKEPEDYVLYEIIYDLIKKYNEISYTKMDFEEEKLTSLIEFFMHATSPKYRRFDDKSSNPRLVLDIIKDAYAIATINNHEIIDIEDIKEAFRCEDRLYSSSIDLELNKLDNLELKKSNCKILKISKK